VRACASFAGCVREICAPSEIALPRNDGARDDAGASRVVRGRTEGGRMAKDGTHARKRGERRTLADRVAKEDGIIARLEAKLAKARDRRARIIENEEAKAKRILTSVNEARALEQFEISHTGTK
jgi:hypothetical protein